jgi:hypothetical protein
MVGLGSADLDHAGAVRIKDEILGRLGADSGLRRWCRDVASRHPLHRALQYFTMYLCASRHTENAFLKASSCCAAV